MKYFLSLCILAYSVLMLILFSGCSNGDNVAGTGSSTGNAKIVGTLLSIDGTPAANSVVYLIPVDYNPVKDSGIVDILVDTVESDGQYTFDVEDTSVYYNIDAKGVAGNYRYFKTNLKSKFEDVDSDLDTGSLTETGVLKVIVSGVEYDTSDGYLFIPGTRVAVNLSDYNDYDDLNYTIYVDSVPAFSYESLHYDEADTNIETFAVIDSVFIVKAKDTLTVGEYQIIPVYDPGIFGIIQDGGVNVNNAIVALLPADYDPVNGEKIADSLKDTTDSNGSFEIRTSDTLNKYNLMITDASSGKSLFKDSIAFTLDSVNQDTFNIQTTGYLKMILQDSQIDTSEGYAFIPGTNITVDLSDYSLFDTVNYTYIISDVSVGDYALVSTAADNGSNVSTLFDSPFKIISTDTAVLGVMAPLIFSISSENSGLPNDDIFTVGADPYGGIWFGTYLGEFIRFIDTTWSISKAADYGVYSSILSIAADDSDGTMWFGTHGAVFSITPGTPALLNVYDPVTSHFPGGSVYSIAVDNENVKWFGSYRYGIVSYDGYIWTHYGALNSPLPSDYVYDIAIDRNNTKWIATRVGITSFDGTNWNTYQNSNSPLTCDTAFCVDVDTNGIVWAGFYDGSVASFNGVSWTVYTSANSTLSGDKVNSVAVDLKGVVWFGSDNGHLTSFNGVEWKDYSDYMPDKTQRLLDIEIDIDNNKWVTTETAGVVLIDHSVK